MIIFFKNDFFVIFQLCSLSIFFIAYMRVADRKNRLRNGRKATAPQTKTRT